MYRLKGTQETNVEDKGEDECCFLALDKHSEDLASSDRVSRGEDRVMSPVFLVERSDGRKSIIKEGCSIVVVVLLEEQRGELTQRIG